MKTRVVCWAKKEDGSKELMAIQLIEESSTVESFAFKQDLVTEDFESQLRNTWKNGGTILLPDHQAYTHKLTITEPLIPEDYKLEDTDLINRMRTEWNFVVLSHRLKSTFQEELEELAHDIDQITDFDSTLWNNLKEFWGKVQTQAREKNLFRHHADDVKTKTNELFDKMKAIRKETNKKLEGDSKKIKSTFLEQLSSIEQKIEGNLSLHPIFEELKEVQRKFKGTKLTRVDQNEVWDKLDGLFKEIKNKRFGGKSGENNQPSQRVERRLQGLEGAIDRMSRSIHRDKKDLEYEEKRKDSVGNQLETQLRSAKIDMIKQRIKSKNAKLEDMQKTKLQLEKKISKLKEREEKEKAKNEIKEQIAQDIKEHHDHVKEDPSLAKAIEEVTHTQSSYSGGTSPVVDKPIVEFIKGVGNLQIFEPG